MFGAIQFLALYGFFCIIYSEIDTGSPWLKFYNFYFIYI